MDLNTGYFEKLRATPAGLIPQLVARFMSEFTRLFFQLILITTVSQLYHWRMAGEFELPDAGIFGLILMCLIATSFGIGVVIALTRRRVNLKFSKSIPEGSN